MRKQTQIERDEVMTRELDRVRCEIGWQKRTGKKQSIPWIEVDLNSGWVSSPPTLLRVVK
jgi:hypothetical protein